MEVTERVLGDIMKKISELLNQQKSTMENVVCLLVGLGLVVLSIFWYISQYSSIDFNDNMEVEIIFIQILWLTMPVLLFVVGIAFIYSSLNTDKKVVNAILIILVWISLYLIFMDERVTVAALLLFASIVIFIITKIFGKVFSTIITLGLSSAFVLIPLLLISRSLIKYVSVYVLVYLCISLCLLFYTINGVKINQCCLKIMGYSSHLVTQYDYSQLKNQMNLIYLVIFILLNCACIFSSVNEISSVANCVNNALITGVCITNVEWKSISWKKENE